MMPGLFLFHPLVFASLADMMAAPPRRNAKGDVSILGIPDWHKPVPGGGSLPCSSKMETGSPDWDPVIDSELIMEEIFGQSPFLRQIPFLQYSMAWD
jgi:hypothetical protein